MWAAAVVMRSFAECLVGVGNFISTILALNPAAPGLEQSVRDRSESPNPVISALTCKKRYNHNHILPMALSYLDIIKQARWELECRNFFIGKLGKVYRSSI